MRIFDIPWINHEGGGIFSVDIHSSGKKLVTAGQDQSGAGLLMIWPLNFLCEEYGNGSEVSGHLARIPHSKSVNCARWSRRDPRRLVCAGDDAVICVYECVGSFNTMGMMGSDKDKQGKSRTLENYRCIHKLHGHSMDVLHVDWSPDERFIASSSLDNSVIVWNAEHLPDRITTLKQANNGHSRGVKGLSWDPIGRFLATQAEDNTLKLWQTDSWECVRTIEDPYQESAGSTLFLRMDWSPDGMYLASPCAMNNGGPTANILVRKDWNHQRDLVGFRKAVSCVRANPRCFSREVDENGECSIVSYFATGSRDRSLSVWIVPSFGRPLLVLEKFFKLSVLDLSWNDMTLAACSHDGVVRILTFSESEIGVPLSSAEMASLSEKNYGFLPDVYKNFTASSTTTAVSAATATALQKSPFNDNFIYMAWRDAIYGSLKGGQRGLLSLNGSRNIFQMKRKVSESYFRRMVARMKRQRRVDSSNVRTSQQTATDVDSYSKNDGVPHDSFQLEDRCLLERKNSSIIFREPQVHPQLHTKTIYWRINSRIRYVNAFNNYSIGYNRTAIELPSGSTQSDLVTKISAFDENSEQWSIYTSDFVVALASNSLWTCCASCSGQFSCVSTRTGRLIFSVNFYSPVTRLILNGDTCIFVLCDGNLTTCDLRSRKCSTKSLCSLFENDAQQLLLLARPDEVVLSTGDMNRYVVDNNTSFSWDTPHEAPTLNLLRTTFYPLPEFSSFMLSREERRILLRELESKAYAAMDDADVERMCKYLCRNRMEPIVDTGELKLSSALSDVLQHAIEQNAESEARFAVALVMLQFIRFGGEQELIDFATHLKADAKFDGMLYRHFTTLLVEYYHRSVVINQENVKLTD